MRSSLGSQTSRNDGPQVQWEPLSRKVRWGMTERTPDICFWLLHAHVHGNIPLQIPLHTNTTWHKHVPHKTHHSKMFNFVVLVYLLCHLTITTNFRIFSSPCNNYQLVKVILILIPCTTTNLTSVSIVFLVLDICHKQHTMYVLLCLASFIWHNVFKIHLYCSVLQDSITLLLY